MAVILGIDSFNGIVKGLKAPKISVPKFVAPKILVDASGRRCVKKNKRQEKEDVNVTPERKTIHFANIYPSQK